MNKLLKLAINASIEAGKEIMKIYNQDFKIEIKKDTSPLTIADKNANRIIMSFLTTTRIPIISEENKQLNYETRKNWNSCWIVDPLDGTKEFIKKNGEFTVNIALIENETPKFGVIYVPTTKELYVGIVPEKKSYKTIINANYKFETFLNDINLINPKKSNNIRVISSRSHINLETQNFINEIKEKNKVVKIVSKGSSLKFCLIAEGKADIYPRFAPTMEWDTAAGQAICEAVGIQVISKQTNKPLLYNKENLLNSWFIVK